MPRSSGGLANMSYEDYTRRLCPHFKADPKLGLTQANLQTAQHDFPGELFRPTHLFVAVKKAPLQSIHRWSR